jgi:hypothetical protein
MSQPASPDHDERLKVLLEEFFHALFCDWSERFGLERYGTPRPTGRSSP